MGAKINGGGEQVTKIYFLLLIISVLVALSYIPVRTEPKRSTAAPPDSVPA